MSMHVTTYFQPERTYLPCTGVGKHINNILLDLCQRDGFDVSLLVSQQYLDERGKLDPRAPLNHLDLRVYPYKRLLLERLWKFCDLPKMDRFIGRTDCIYAPVAEYIPVSRDIPLLITMHDLNTIEPNLPWSQHRNHKIDRWKTQVWVAKSIERSDFICTVSEYSKQRIIDLLSVSPEKIGVVGNGVDRDFFELADANKSQIEPPLSQPYIVIVGGLRYKKGGYHVIDVARELTARNSKLKLLVVGANEPELLEIAKTLDNIVIAGVISEERLPVAIGMASSLLFLSLYEGFGIPMLEAMATGVPAVVANRGALPSIGAPAAIVVEPERAGEIADILINLERDTALRAHHIGMGRELAARFSWPHCVDRLVRILSKY
jgi:glycosyltransferase involved in cell wall biosynthesis